MTTPCGVVGTYRTGNARVTHHSLGLKFIIPKASGKRGRVGEIATDGDTEGKCAFYWKSIGMFDTHTPSGVRVGVNCETCKTSVAVRRLCNGYDALSLETGWRRMRHCNGEEGMKRFNRCSHLWWWFVITMPAQFRIQLGKSVLFVVFMFFLWRWWLLQRRWSVIRGVFSCWLNCKWKSLA